MQYNTVVKYNSEYSVINTVYVVLQTTKLIALTLQVQSLYDDTTNPTYITQLLPCPMAIYN